ncbi:MAG: alpha/beta hydrolase fold domain-containing protein [Planctomycetota bacterium]
MKTSLFVIVVLFLGIGRCGAQETRSNDSIEAIAKRFIKTRDQDGNGTLSLEEFPGKNKRLFDRIDTDGDREVSLKEDVAYRKSRMAGRQGDQGGGQQDANVTIHRDLVYTAVGSRKLRLDLYVPKADSRAKKSLLPVIVRIHGGGWKSGSKGNGGRARGVETRGYALVDVEYRLSGEAIFPAQIQDCKAAIRWVRANSARYGLNPDRIGVIGSSAGGHLAAMLGTSDAKEFETQSNAGHSSRVQAVCDLWGPTDLLQMDDHRLPGSRLTHNAADSPESLLVGGPIQSEPYRSLAAKANPITYIPGRSLPPFLIIHGEGDLLVPPHQSELLRDALVKNGTDVTLRLVRGGHGLRGGDLNQRALVNLAVAFFDQHLK